jgi:hypothetical protein
VRVAEIGRTPSRGVPSIIANKLIPRATGVDLRLRLLALASRHSLPLAMRMYRFIRRRERDGRGRSEVVVNHRARVAGTSKYGLSRTIRVILDLLTVKFLLKYATRPLQIFGLVGLSMGTLGALVLGYLAYVRLFAAQSIGDRPLLLFGILLALTGVQFLTFGLLAEMQARTYYESQDKATYVVRETVGFPADRSEARGRPRPCARAAGRGTRAVAARVRRA